MSRYDKEQMAMTLVMVAVMGILLLGIYHFVGSIDPAMLWNSVP